MISMPYISPAERLKLDFTIKSLAALLKTSENYEGNLNYCISTLADNLLIDNFSYGELNKIIGALECAKLELYRRLAAPYEDQKIIINGDVFTSLKE